MEDDLGQEHAGSSTAQAGRKEGNRMWMCRMRSGRLAGGQSSNILYPEGLAGLSRVPADTQVGGMWVRKRCHSSLGVRAGQAQGHRALREIQTASKRSDDDGPHSVCGVCFSLNKSTSYLSLCLILSSFCNETSRT